MSELLANAQRILNIDQHNLDKEWTEQPKLYLDFATALATARQEADQAKAELEIVDAELDKNIRLHPTRFDIDGKITENVVSNTILAHKSHTKAYQRLIAAKHEVAVLQAAVEALEHRKKALENLVQLWLASYFAEPRVKGETREKMEEAEKRNVRRPIKRRGNDDTT